MCGLSQCHVKGVVLLTCNAMRCHRCWPLHSMSTTFNARARHPPFNQTANEPISPHNGHGAFLGATGISSCLYMAARLMPAKTTVLLGPKRHLHLSLHRTRGVGKPAWAPLHATTRPIGLWVATCRAWVHGHELFAGVGHAPGTHMPNMQTWAGGAPVLARGQACLWQAWPAAAGRGALGAPPPCGVSIATGPTSPIGHPCLGRHMQALWAKQPTGVVGLAANASATCMWLVVCSAPVRLSGTQPHHATPSKQASVPGKCPKAMGSTTAWAKQTGAPTGHLSGIVRPMVVRPCQALVRPLISLDNHHPWGRPTRGLSAWGVGCRSRLGINWGS